MVKVLSLEMWIYRKNGLYFTGTKTIRYKGPRVALNAKTAAKRNESEPSEIFWPQ